MGLCWPSEVPSCHPEGGVCFKRLTDVDRKLSNAFKSVHYQTGVSGLEALRLCSYSSLTVCPCDHHHTVVTANSSYPFPTRSTSSSSDSGAVLGGSSAPALPSRPLILMNLTGAKQYGGNLSHPLAHCSQDSSPVAAGFSSVINFADHRFECCLFFYSQSFSIFYSASALLFRTVFLAILRYI